MKCRTLTLAIFVAMASAVPAIASTITAVFDGTVTSAEGSPDRLGVTGDPTGKAVKLTYTFDTSLGSRYGFAGALDSVYGGPDYGPTNPLLSAVLDIGGQQLSFGPDRSSELYSCGQNWCDNDIYFSSTWQNWSSGTAFGSWQLYAFTAAPNGILPLNNDTPFSISSSQAIRSEGGMQNYAFDSNTFSMTVDAIRFTFDRVSVTNADVAAVPLPAGASMLAAALAGFGVVRRRKMPKAQSAA